MDLRQMLAVVSVADTGSVTHASRRLHVVQSAVTRQVKAIEDEMGLQLFVRGASGMTLTAEGETFVAHARRILHDVQRVREELSHDTTALTGVVRVGLLESTSALLAEPLFRRVSEIHPGVRLQIETAYSGHLQQWLDDGNLDLSMLYNLSSTPSIAVTDILREELWAVGPSDDRLLDHQGITWTELLRHPLILPVAGHGLRALIDRALDELEMSVRPVAETNALSIQRNLVAAGHGWTILPASGVAHDVAVGLLSARPLRDPVVTRSVGVGLGRAGRVSASAHAVARTLVATVRDLVTSGSWPGSVVDSREHRLR